MVRPEGVGRVLPVRVVEDSDELTALFVAEGTPVLRRVRDDGSELAAGERERSGAWRLAEGEWRDSTLMLTRPGAAASWWACFVSDEFRLWYVNLQAPLEETPLGFDTEDHVLDVVIEDGAARLKDEDELADAVAIGRFSPAKAAAIRGEAERALVVAAAGDWPLGSGWERWRAPALPLPVLPLETGRLTLRPLRRDDLDAVARLQADRRLFERSNRPHPRTIDESAGELDDSLAHWNTHGFGSWAVLEQSSCHLLGVLELESTGSGVAGIEPDEVEIGWWIDPDRWGEGIAAEAARAVVGFAFDRPGVDHVVAYLRPENAASRRVAEQLGLHRRGDGRARNGDPVEVYELRSG